jgi:hypothetical protein
MVSSVGASAICIFLQFATRKILLPGGLQSD